MHRGCTTTRVLVLVSAALTVAAAHGQTCQPFWAGAGTVDPVRHGGELAVFDDGMGGGRALYAVCFPDQGMARGYSRWNGQHWDQLNAGLPPLRTSSLTLRVLDDGTGPRLFGVSMTANPEVWRGWFWTGTAWEPAPANLCRTTPNQLYERHDAAPSCSFDDGTGMAIYGTCHWPAGGIPVLSVCRWDGAAWLPFGEIASYSTFRIEALDLGDGPSLYVAGCQISGVSSHNVARWDGHAWHALGSGLVCSFMNDMVVFDAGEGPEAYFGGWIVEAGGQPVSGLARWNGARWASVPGAPAPTPEYVRALTVFDDGLGSALYVMGDFTATGNGTPAQRIARYDGLTWRALGAGLAPTSPSPGGAVAAFDDGRGASLFISVGSSATSSTGGGILGNNIAQWVGCPNCYANCDNSTAAPTLNVRDFICFLNKFAVQDPYANCTVDATIDVADFVCFLNKFGAGCP